MKMFWVKSGMKAKSKKIYFSTFVPVVDFFFKAQKEQYV